jgi:hypothetical protein
MSKIDIDKKQILADLFLVLQQQKLSGRRQHSLYQTGYQY